MPTDIRGKLEHTRVEKKKHSGDSGTYDASLFLQFLDVVLAEIKMSVMVTSQDVRGRLVLRYCHQSGL